MTIIVFVYYCNILYISFPIFYLATTRSSNSAKGNIDRGVIVPDNVIHRNKSATVSADAIGNVSHGKKKGKDMETNLEAARATSLEQNFDGAPGKKKRAPRKKKRNGSPNDSLAKRVKFTSTNSSEIDSNVNVGNVDLDVSNPGVMLNHNGNSIGNISSQNGVDHLSTIINELRTKSPHYKDRFYKNAFPRAMQLFSQLDHTEHIDQDSLYAILLMVEDLLRNGVDGATIIKDLQEYASNASQMNLHADDASSVSSVTVHTDVSAEKLQAATNNIAEAASNIVAEVGNEKATTNIAADGSAEKLQPASNIIKEVLMNNTLPQIIYLKVWETRLLKLPPIILLKF